ncbi:MAG: hypothetical protein HRU46_15035 [Verrucomicrobiales bacterium]|nr:hypothetical protein [Verrucomicrobiales bacterium]
MRPLFTAFSLTLLTAGGFAADIDMPEWGSSSDSEGYALGGGLWPAGLLPDGAPEAEEGEATTAVAETPTNPDGSPLTFYGPLTTTDAGSTAVGNNTGDAGEIVDQPAQAPPVEALPPIEGELRNVYFGYPPVDYLIDPQRLLTEQKSNDIKRFLEFHSDESDFKIYVMVIGETQAIPDDIDLQKIHKEWFSDQNTVLMVYHREHPDLTEFVYNENVRSALPKSVFDRIRQNCLREGAATDLAPDQVEKMAIELSIQLYWLWRLMAAEGAEAKAISEAESVYDLPASADAPELLREYAPSIFLEESSRRAISILITIAVILACLVLVAFVGWIVIWLRGLDRIGGGPLIFPSFEPVTRLGGEFSGGGFVSMSFDINDTSSHSS